MAAPVIVEAQLAILHPGPGESRREPKAATTFAWFLPALLLLWLAAVAAMAAHHVPWRDEVRLLFSGGKGCQPLGAGRRAPA